MIEKLPKLHWKCWNYNCSRTFFCKLVPWQCSRRDQQLRMRVVLTQPTWCQQENARAQYLIKGIWKVCVYVCTYVRVHACLCLRKIVCVYAFTFVHLSVCLWRQLWKIPWLNFHLLSHAITRAVCAVVLNWIIHTISTLLLSCYSQASVTTTLYWHRTLDHTIPLIPALPSVLDLCSTFAFLSRSKRSPGGARRRSNLRSTCTNARRPSDWYQFAHGRPSLKRRNAPAVDTSKSLDIL